MHIPFGALLVLLASASGRLAVLHAQEQSAQQVPSERAIALLPNYSSGPTHQPQIRVGQAPEGFSLDVLPSGAEVLGSLTQGRQSTVVATMPGDERAAEQALAERLTATGWERRARFGQRTGFQADLLAATARLAESLGARVKERMLHSETFCRGDTSLQPWALPRPAGGSLLRIEFSERPASFECGRSARAWPELPSLTAPPGARAMGTGQSGSNDRMEARGSVVTDLGPSALLAHYAAQLQKAGWSTAARTLAQLVATQQLNIRDAQGRPWQGMLLVLEIPGGKEKEVSLRVTREGASDGAHGR